MPQMSTRPSFANSHQLETETVSRHRIQFINLASSRNHRLFGYKKSTEIEYDSGFTFIRGKNHLDDRIWHDILSKENLLLAWARVRNNLGSQSIEDTLEIRLFEANIQERLDKLRTEILSYQWDALGISDMLNFQVPKGSEKPPRPMNMCRLEDQILATAVLQTRASKYLRSHIRSYAYRMLGKSQGEFLYENWLPLYQDAFLKEARQAAQKNPSYQVIRTDLSSYYTNVLQSKLLSEIVHEARLYKSRGETLVEKLIIRECGLGKDGYGIPQGHIASGVMSNIFLAEIDNLFGPQNQWGIEYFRYVDDMIFMLPPGVEAEFVLARLDQELSTLSANKLIRSKDKTSEVMRTDEFLEQTAPDKLVNELSKEHNILLSELYKLDRNHWQVLKEHWWPFVERYQKLLADIGVYISIPRLSRKLSQNLYWRKRAFWWLKRMKLPRVQRLEDLEDTVGWVSEFHRLNTEWVQRRNEHVIKLSNLFKRNIRIMKSQAENAPMDYARAKTRFTFAINRLGQLSYDGILDMIVEMLVQEPWTLNVRRVSQALALQGQEDLLMDAISETLYRTEDEWGYVRASMLKAFSDLPSVSDEAVALLRDLALNASVTS